jgi:hypothetical protein
MTLCMQVQMIKSSDTDNGEAGFVYDSDLLDCQVLLVGTVLPIMQTFMLAEVGVGIRWILSIRGFRCK